ncbi:hypothetical protein MARINOS108_10108 [Marinoscillum sp. 108]|nr:hypothetical protein MARINOS108_10108 [Marinoscillum sp. 108]
MGYFRVLADADYLKFFEDRPAFARIALS